MNAAQKQLRALLKDYRRSVRATLRGELNVVAFLQANPTVYTPDGEAVRDDFYALLNALTSLGVNEGQCRMRVEAYAATFPEGLDE